MKFYEFQEKVVDTMNFLIKIRRYLLGREDGLSKHQIEICKKLYKTIQSDKIEDLGVRFAFLGNSGTKEDAVVYKVFHLIKDEDVKMKQTLKELFKKIIDGEQIRNKQDVIGLIEYLIDKTDLEIEMQKKENFEALIGFH